MINPIVLILSDHSNVVISPRNPNSHDEKSWQRVKLALEKACIQIIYKSEDLNAETLIELCNNQRPDLRCYAVEGVSIMTAQLVE